MPIRKSERYGIEKISNYLLDVSVLNMEQKGLGSGSRRSSAIECVRREERGLILPNSDW